MQLSAILLTHHHPDHVGAVNRCRQQFGVPVWAHAETARLLAASISVDRELGDGERLPLGIAPDGQGEWELECHFTPGHAAGHLCFFERRYGSLLCGDMMSTLSSILVDPADGDMAQYMDSLQRLAELPARMVFPAHGPATAAGSAALRQQWEHRHTRETQVVEAIAGGAKRVEEVVRSVYPQLDPSMQAFAALSVRSILVKLRHEGRVEGLDEALRTVG